MKVVYSNNDTHTIKLVPRFQEFLSVDLEIQKEGFEKIVVEGIGETTIGTTFEVGAGGQPNYEYDYLNGELYLTFNYNFVRNNTYNFTVKASKKLLYAGKILATDDINVQNYKESTKFYV